MIMGWFGSSAPEPEKEFQAARDSGFRGWWNHDTGEAIMSRTDPKDGQALGFGDRGWDGRGTPDDRSR